MKIPSLAIIALFSAALAAPAASQNSKLHPPLSGGQDVHRYEMSADGKRVVYLADQDVDGPLNLYSVGARGEAMKRLDSRPCAQFVISPDSRRVVYTRYPTSLCSVAIDGSEAPIDIGLYTGAFDVSPDGRTVVFLVGGSLNGDLHSVPIDGSAPPVPLHASGNIHHIFRFTPDGRRVVYLTEGTIGNMASMGHVYSALVDGSEPPVVLNTSQSPATIGAFAFDPTSRWLVYREGSLQTFSDGLFTVPLDGSAAPVLLNPPLGPGGAQLAFTEFGRPRFTADGSRVLYLLDHHGDDRELFSAPIDGSETSVLLNAPLPAGGEVLTFRITLDGTRAIYFAEQESVGTYELYSVPVLGGAAPVKLNAPLVAGGSVNTFELSPDGERLAYVADQEIDGESQLYLAALDAGSPVIRLSDPAVTPVVSGNSSTLEFVPDGSTLVYASFDAGVRLHAVEVDGNRRTWRLDGPQVPGGSVRSSDPFPLLSGDQYFTRIGHKGSRAVYRADQDQDEVFELYTSPLFLHRARR